MESVEPQKRTHSRLLVLFLVLSLFIHANFIALAIVMAILNPPAPKTEDSQGSGVTLNLVPLPSPKHLLATTPPDPNAPENPNAEIEADNNSQLATKQAISRSQNQIPDIEGHAPTHDFHNTAYIPPKNQPVAPPAQDHQQIEKQVLTPKSNPTQPTHQQNPQPQFPIAQAPKQAPTPHPAPRAQAVQLVDPNGLPVLPPIAGATVLPPDPQVNQVQAVRGGAPPPSMAEQSGDVDGISAISDHDSISARQSDLGVYMAKVRRAIGSIWYPRVENQMQLVSVGVVHVKVIFHADGTVDVFPGESGDQSDRAIILRSLSMTSIKEAAPFDPFPSIDAERVRR